MCRLPVTRRLQALTSTRDQGRDDKAVNLHVHPVQPEPAEARPEGFLLTGC